MNLNRIERKVVVEVFAPLCESNSVKGIKIKEEGAMFDRDKMS